MTTLIQTAFLALSLATTAVATLMLAPVAKEEPLDVEDQGKVAKATQAFQESLECLALNIYHEARSEPETGQMAVAAVTLNRVGSPSFPDTVCGVVKQGGEKRRHRCQFSWWCDGKKDEPTETDAWKTARRIAWLSLKGFADDPTDGALYYHSRHVKPGWAESFERTARIGQHLFYKPEESPQIEVAALK